MADPAPLRPWRQGLREVLVALLVGGVLATPVTLLLGSAPVTIRATFHGRVDDAQVEALGAWASAEAALVDPAVRRDGAAVVLDARRRGALRTAILPPWRELGFPALSTVTTRNRFDPLELAADPVFLLALLLGAQAGFLAVALAARRRAGPPWPPLRTGRPVAAVARGVGAGLLLAAFGWLYGRVVSAPQPWDAVRTLATGPRVAVLAGGIVAAPVCEELFFRGVVFARFVAAGRAPAGAIASAGLFAAVHPAPATLPAIFLLGLAFAWLYRRSGSILAPVAAHATNNAIAFALLLG